MRATLLVAALVLPSTARADCEALLGQVGFFGSPFYIKTAMEPEGGVRRAREALVAAAAECRDSRPYLLLAMLRRGCDERRHVLLETCSPTIGGRRFDTLGAILDAGLERFPADPRLIGLRLWLDAASLQPETPGKLKPAATAEARQRLTANLTAVVAPGRPLPDDAFTLLSIARARLVLGDPKGSIEAAQAVIQRDPELLDGRDVLFDAQLASGEEEAAIAEVEKRASRSPSFAFALRDRPWERRPVASYLAGADLLRRAAGVAARRKMVTQSIHLQALSFLRPGSAEQPSPSALRRDPSFVAAQRQLARLLPPSRDARRGLVVISLRDDARPELLRIAQALVGL